MKKFVLGGVWLLFYVMCLLLSYITAPSVSQQAALFVLSVVFFVPGFWLLIDARRQHDAKMLRILRWISGAVLLLTVVLLIANVSSVLASETVGNILYTLLIIVSVPMVCSQSWLISLFLWAFLFLSTLGRKKK